MNKNKLIINSILLLYRLLLESYVKSSINVFPRKKAPDKILHTNLELGCYPVRTSILMYVRRKTAYLMPIRFGLGLWILKFQTWNISECLCAVTCCVLFFVFCDRNDNFLEVEYFLEIVFYSWNCDRKTTCTCAVQ